MGKHPILVAWLLFLISEIFAALLLYNLYEFDALIWKEEMVEKSQWHWHVLVMSSCMIVLNGHGMVIFRLMPRCRTQWMKYLHGLIHTGVLAGAIYGMWLAHKFMLDMEHPYFLHTYMGFFTMGLYLFQWLLSLFIYLYMYSNQRRRKQFATCHNFLGVVILQLSINAACIQLQTLDYEINYLELHANLAMASMVIYGLVINSIVLNPYLEWRLVGPI